MKKLLSKTDLEKYIKEQAMKVVLSESTQNSKKIEFENTADINHEEEKIKVNEIKSLAEEFKRMKELIDFRSPMLGGNI